MRRWFAAVILAISVIATGNTRAAPYSWPTYDTGPGPGGFAKVTLESPTHAGRVKGPNFAIRLRTDNPRAAVVVKLDGVHVDTDCEPFVSRTSNPADYPQWEFMSEMRLVMDIPVCGVGPGLHTLEILRGAFGSSLPNTNEQRIAFIVE